MPCNAKGILTTLILQGKKMALLQKYPYFTNCPFLQEPSRKSLNAWCSKMSMPVIDLNSTVHCISIHRLDRSSLYWPCALLYLCWLCADSVPALLTINMMPSRYCKKLLAILSRSNLHETLFHLETAKHYFASHPILKSLGAGAINMSLCDISKRLFSGSNRKNGRSRWGTE